jgi:hypothetical protein
MDPNEQDPFPPSYVMMETDSVSSMLSISQTKKNVQRKKQPETFRQSLGAKMSAPCRSVHSLLRVQWSPN